MQFGVCCIECLVSRHAALARKKGDSAKAVPFLKEIIAAIAAAPPDVAAPWLSPQFDRIIQKYYGPDGGDYERVKRFSNDYMLRLLPRMEALVDQSPHPLAAALSIAQASNYIDFTALYDQVTFHQLDQLLADAAAKPLAGPELDQLQRELPMARKLLYICDNAGEIIADRLVAQQLRRQYPQLSLVFAVRGKPAVNDALREDAVTAGLDKLGQIVDNGSGISGTELAYLSPSLKAQMETADILLAKGQGNFETMLGCGYNVYYVFLCKCRRFTDFFQVTPLTGMLVNERRLPRKTFAD